MALININVETKQSAKINVFSCQFFSITFYWKC